MHEYLLIGIVGILAIGGGLGVVFLANPINNVMSLLLTMLALAGLYAAMGAHVAALFQVIIYVGAILVLFIFAVMLLNLREAAGRIFTGPQTPGIGGAALALAIAMGTLLWGSLRKSPVPDEGLSLLERAGVHRLAIDLFTDHLLVFELTAVLLLVASIGAIIISRK
ncbi:MAG: NADH-quinone oxidoreductase subunit J [Syntrophales bacterium]|jgi:NADH:ubiquinone oxidoreductase subunit 6 (subunit J)|nr:NADH-quinone oxidoreductase subunit J [Syntrophales bacterium]MCK9527235.1 NADH-quinone oxidoreductase subunit J [Syntrophales bacterium]MDX9921295.1 NADH-quinone oxidoreductase subunit J [Syntrophales bacterium]